MGATGKVKVNSCARRGAVCYKFFYIQAVFFRFTAGKDYIDYVIFNFFIHVNLVNRIPRLDYVLRRNNRADLGNVFHCHPFLYLQLLLAVRVIHLEFQHEPVNLGFRQRISALLFDGILGGQH